MIMIMIMQGGVRYHEVAARIMMVFCCSFGAGFAGFYVVQMLVCCCSFGTVFYWFYVV